MACTQGNKKEVRLMNTLLDGTRSSAVTGTDTHALAMRLEYETPAFARMQLSVVVAGASGADNDDFGASQPF